jgi:hypothetical protein
VKIEYIVKGYENAFKEGGKCGLDVFFGWEFHYDGIDILTYGLEPSFLFDNPDLDKLPIDKYCAIVRQNGGYLAQAHPFRGAVSGGKNKDPLDPVFLDGIEVFNASRANKPEEYQKALEYAKLHNLPMQAGTDSHFNDKKEKIYSGIVLNEKAKDIQDIITAIKSGDAEMMIPDF